MKHKKTFENPSLELLHRQLLQARRMEKIIVVLFKKINNKHQKDKFSDWLLECPKGIDFEVKY